MTIEERLAALESAVAALQPAEPLGPRLLEMMASNVVRRVPKNWTGRDVTGMRYDALTSDECTRLADYHGYLAKKGAADVPVRMDNQGRPWWQADRKAAQALTAFAAKATADEF